MGRYIEQNENQSELQQRIASELRAKAVARAKQDDAEATGYHKKIDGVEDTAYIKGYKQTTTLAPVWLLIFFASIGVFVFFVYLVNSRG